MLRIYEGVGTSLTIRFRRQQPLRMLNKDCSLSEACESSDAGGTK